MPSEREVEAAARAIDKIEAEACYTHSWEKSDEDWQELCRYRARAALSAAEAVREGEGQLRKMSAQVMANNAERIKERTRQDRTGPTAKLM
jgi:hypothetical protein